MQNEPFSKSTLSKRTLYEFLRANSSTASAHPVHRTPWLSRPKSFVPMSFPSTGKPEAKTALQRLAQEPSDLKPIVPLTEHNRPVPVSKRPLDVDPAKPPPMFENPKRERRALVVSHVKGSTPERIKKFRAGGGSSTFEGKVRKLLTLDDLYKAVLGVDFADIDKCMPSVTDIEPTVTFRDLEAYKQHQSEVLLVETMEGFRQSLSSGFLPASQTSAQAGLFGSANVTVTTVTRKGREFSLLTLKKISQDDDVSLSQGDVVLLVKPNSAVLDPILKYGFCSSLSPKSFPENDVLFGIIERSKPLLVLGRNSKSVQLRCPMASKDNPLGYSPSDAGTIGAEYVAVIIHSLSVVEREWSALCSLKQMDWFVSSLLGHPLTVGKLNVANDNKIISQVLKCINELNYSQREAVMNAVQGQEKTLTLIQGPPGTGKTHTVVSLLKCLSVQGVKKTIVAAPSNAAADELMSRFMSVVKPSMKSVVRIGRNSTLPELREYCLDQRVMESQSQIEQSKFEQYKSRKDKLFEDIRELNEEINSVKDSSVKGEKIRMKERVKSQLDQLKSKEQEQTRIARDSIYKKFLNEAQFIFGTLSSFGSDPIVENLTSQIDVCVIDEAAQAIEVSALIPLRYRPKKIVLVGDPQQLPAVVKSASAKRAGFDMSLMERLQLTGQHETMMLKQQYRMDDGIARYPSQQFYEGLLETHESVLERREIQELRILSEHALMFVDVPGAGDIRQGTSLMNPREARLAVDLVKFLIQLTKGALSIGVISPYRQQVNLIRSLVPKELPGVEVDSVDAFQGREKDVIVFSCVRAGGSSETSLGFLADQRRLNVAITRARRACFVIGSEFFLRENGGPVWKGLISHCQVVEGSRVESLLIASNSI